MVKSKKIKSNLIENQVFDQSVVGVFPKDPNLLYYLLGFFNTDVFNTIVHTINPTANNSSNYIKKVPVIVNEDGINYINGLVEQLVNIKRETTKIDAEIEREIEAYFNDIYKDWLEVEEKELEIV